MHATEDVSQRLSAALSQVVKVCHAIAEDHWETMDEERWRGFRWWLTELDQVLGPIDFKPEVSRDWDRVKSAVKRMSTRSADSLTTARIDPTLRRDAADVVAGFFRATSVGQTS